MQVNVNERKQQGMKWNELKEVRKWRNVSEKTAMKSTNWWMNKNWRKSIKVKKSTTNQHAQSNRRWIKKQTKSDKQKTMQ